MLERIGGGRYSEVYKGINLITEEYVVIKVLKPSRNIYIYIYSKSGENQKGMFSFIKTSREARISSNARSSHRSLKQNSNFSISIYIYIYK